MAAGEAALDGVDPDVVKPGVEDIAKKLAIVVFDECITISQLHSVVARQGH